MKPIRPTAAPNMPTVPYARGVAYAIAADAYGWHHADPDADCPFTDSYDMKAWHRGVHDEAKRQHEAAKRCASYYFPVWLSA